MLLVAGFVFTYYTIWAIFLVSSIGLRIAYDIVDSYPPIFSPSSTRPAPYTTIFLHANGQYACLHFSSWLDFLALVYSLVPQS